MCLDPIFKNYYIENDKVVIDWKSRGHQLPTAPVLLLKCGKCPECMNSATTEWANRCFLEAREHKENCVLTLTYADSPGELVKRDYQLFLKRLRKAIYPKKIKYFISGEYGSLFGRPHYHLIIFGWRPDDCHFYSLSGSGTKMYNSEFVSKLWGKGYVTVDIDCSYKAMFYSAKYMQKAISMFGKQKLKPFIAMSKGIAEAAAYRYDPDTNPYIYIKGRKFRAPRYFRRVYRKNVGEDWYVNFELVRTLKVMQHRYSLSNFPSIPKKNVAKSSNFRKIIQDYEQSIRVKRDLFLQKFHLLI